MSINNQPRSRNTRSKANDAAKPARRHYRLLLVPTLLTGGQFALAQPTYNQIVVDEAFGSACSQLIQMESGAEMADRCREISSIDQISALVPDEIASMGTAAVDFGFRQLDLLHARIVDLRDSQKRPTLYGLANPRTGKALAALSQATGGAAGDAEEPFRDDPFGFFVKGTFNVGDRDRTSSEMGFDIDRKAVTVGADYRFTDSLVIGLAGGYSYTDTDFDGANGSMDTDSGEFSLYGSYFLPQDFYVDWALGYSFHDYEMDRRIQYNGFSATATGRPEGDQYVASIGIGKDIYVEEFFFNPYVRVEYLNLSIDGYRESGGGGLGLAVDDQSVKSVTSTVGAQISRAFSMPWGILSPSLRFEWVHQYKDDDRSINARFLQAPGGTGGFSIATDNPDRNYFNLGGSLAATLPGGRAAFLRYESRLGQDEVSDHTVEVGVRLPF